MDPRGVYEGEFENGTKKGKGKMTYNDGTIYDGMWLADRKHGQGVLHLPMDSFIMKYVIFFSPNFFHRFFFFLRFATFFFFCSLDFSFVSSHVCFRYSGEWHKDMKQGKGNLFLANGTIIEGNFSENAVRLTPSLPSPFALLPSLLLRPSPSSLHPPPFSPPSSFSLLLHLFPEY